MHTQTMPVPRDLLVTLQDSLEHARANRDEAYAHFLNEYPQYLTTEALDSLRAREYTRLERLSHIYLDYTGGGLYSEAQVHEHMELLTNNVYGNPHSLNPTSLAATETTESARRYVLHFLNADPDEYVVIFTMNASGALKLVGEAYPFAENGQYLLTFDNHNSVNGIREYARCCNAPVTYSPLDPKTLRIDEASLEQNLNQALPDGNNLFAFPAQSNFSGIQHDLNWIERAHAKGWDVLLDAAAFLPTNRLDLSHHHPDFVTLSFYKMFGYPTGIGALIARREALARMKRPWFAGGTISVASVQGDGHFLHSDEAGYEDGTINYLGIPAVEIGLRHLENAGIDTIHTRVHTLTQYLLNALSKLEHSNGQPLVYIYGDATAIDHGGTLALNFYDPNGSVFDYRLVESLANTVNISLRTGCFCNPGAGEIAHHISGDRLRDCFESTTLSFEDLAGALLQNGDTDVVGAVRISTGIVSNFADVYQFVHFAKSFIDRVSDGVQM